MDKKSGKSFPNRHGEADLFIQDSRLGRDYGRSETSTVTLNFVSNSEGSQDCR